MRCEPGAGVDATPGALARWLDRIGVEHPKGVARGLDHVRAVAARLGVLPPAPRTIVVAGTNGKGSTTAFAEQLLLAAGRSVGTTTSPHIHRFNERIRIDGMEADDARIADAFEQVDAARGNVHLSYFEWAVLAALVAIRRAGVDCAVLEVGLGGRLDAVNAVDADVAVITNIGLDHQAYLGATREAIGAEKAGILRPRIPAVIGEPAPPQSVLSRAAACRAPTYLAGRDFGCGGGALRLGARAFRYPPSAIAPENAAAALQAVALAGVAPEQPLIDRAARGARNPGRCEVVEAADGRTWIVDVAHNPDGARFFAAQVAARFPNRRCRAIVGCLADKDAAGICAALGAVAQHIAFADTGSARGASARYTRMRAGRADAFAGPLDAAMAHVLAAADGADDAILVCGSFDVVERVRNHLIRDRPQDAPPC